MSILCNAKQTVLLPALVSTLDPVLVLDKFIFLEHHWCPREFIYLFTLFAGGCDVVHVVVKDNL